MPPSPDRPDVERLVAVIRRNETRWRPAKVPRTDAEIAAHLDAVLFSDRQLWHALTESIITRPELVDAIADRLMRFLGHERIDHVDADALVRDLDESLPAIGPFVDARGIPVVLQRLGAEPMAPQGAPWIPHDDPLSIAALVSSRLTAIGVTHMLSGSLALTVYAEPRMSRDLDFVVDLGAFQVPRFVAAFSHDFYVDEPVVREAVRARDLFNLVHEPTGWKIDIVVAKDDPYRQLELSRRRPIVLGGVAVPVVSPEDLVLSKLWWSKDSGSELQHRDIRNLLAGAEALDWTYLRRWAQHLGVLERLESLGDGS